MGIELASLQIRNGSGSITFGLGAAKRDAVLCGLSFLLATRAILAGTSQIDNVG